MSGSLLLSVGQEIATPSALRFHHDLGYITRNMELETSVDKAANRSDKS